jgi:hypothetical protein
MLTVMKTRQWCCDGCRKDGKRVGGPSFSCIQCDFDVCEVCVQQFAWPTGDTESEALLELRTSDGAFGVEAWDLIYRFSVSALACFANSHCFFLPLKPSTLS